MQFFTWLEAHCFSRGDADLCPGARIASNASLPRSHAEDAEAAQFNALSRSQGFFKSFKHGVDCRFGLGAWQACALNHMVHDVLFNQSGHLASATVLDC